MAQPSEALRMSPRDERALVDGLCSSDPTAVSEFLERTHRSVFAMACGLTTDRNHREDWTHEVLLRLVEELGRGRFVYRWPGCFWSWFAMRARFLLLNQRRRHLAQQQRIEPEHLSAETLEALALPQSQTPDRVLQGVQARETIERCIEKLDSENHRRALSLLIFEEMSYQEIADAVATPLNTVRSWIRRARAAVRSCVSDAYRLGPVEEELG